MARHADKSKQREMERLARGPAGDLVMVAGIDFDAAHVGGLPQEITEGWRDNHFAVWVSREPSVWGVVMHLWIRRHTGEARRPSWKDAQRIKDTIAGWDRVAVEVYPRRVDVVDQANMYHLWILPETVVMPFGLGIAGQEARALQLHETLPGVERTDR